ncbi:MAG: hypothetical protein JWP29_7 [Rhodoferax sp.]|nr:hypothetical protein [Rhodoferax sp.]
MGYRLAALLVVLWSLTGQAFGADAPGDAHTIRITDLPGDPPGFESFPAGKLFTGKPAKPDIRTQALARLFRTRLLEGARTGSNFAGHYTVIRWGCGAGCTQLAIADAVSGRVFFPANLQSVDNVNVDTAFDDAGINLVQYRRDSRLLVVIGGINETDALRGISYFAWEGDHLTRLRFQAKP